MAFAIKIQRNFVYLRIANQAEFVMIPLGACAALMKDAPNCQAFIAAWQMWRGTHMVPNLDDVRPEILGNAINGVSVVELLSPNDAVYRLVGNLHTEVMGREMAGTYLSEVTRPEEQKARMTRLWKIANTPCGVFVQLTVVRQSGVSDPVCRVILPVRPSEPTEPMRLYGAMDRHGEAKTIDNVPADLISLAQNVDYIDISHGVPE
ncbi:MAG: PAS domain-containing protein [Rhodospirillaceae bacterium]|jgi:hypothetical protein|nr:PAS domain-containing protein [Rhodospirillaceae bacterium]MBT4489213.1 PAS domain-containing protein [Rhodospirillaceae bacterium]MBT5898037.1 PAS domain-containing protein [Rhodospirillaceae bacterium]MBT7756542.1 PAS domain-containing protein [Rhodospirillaceae bacterium]